MKLLSWVVLVIVSITNRDCSGQEATKVCNNQDATPGSATLGYPAFCAGICLGSFGANGYPTTKYGDVEGRNCLECERIWVVEQSSVVNTCQIIETAELESKRQVYTSQNPIPTAQYEVLYIRC